MGNYGNHNRNILSRHGGFSDDEWVIYRDNQQGGSSDYVAPGKALRPDHHKMPRVESSVNDQISTLLKSLKDVMVNKPMIHYQLGCAYKAAGDLDNAKYYLELAAKIGHPDAKEELDRLMGVKHVEACAVQTRKMPLASARPSLPKVKWFKVTEIVLPDGSSGFLLQVNVVGWKDLQTVSAVLKSVGRRCVDIYASHQAALETGFKIKKNGLNAI